ncbi:MAG: transglutaminase-like domain-containing protein [Myxococcota bacterium]|nr:transglutaminase-like domain-containing protein [Myxococcota bacterium]
MISIFLFACNSTISDPPKMRLETTSSTLTELSREAVSLAPDWLQNDLSLSLYRLDENLQNELAALMVDADDPYMLDEIGFAIAHISPEVLANPDFYPQIIAENAQLIYERDPLLHYVALIDDGVPGSDPDYYTTARYQIEDENGNTIEKTIDRDIYYWYLVHPRMEDELPFYIDGWAECGNSVQGYRSECATTPEDGMFWRHFLWEGALDECPPDRDCPVVKDYVTETDVMWKSKSYNRDDNGAIGEIINWQIDAMNFGAGNERPIQPNRIYAVGCGNCGEWSDIATAAARSALIPSQNVGARGNDHVWNEFWDEDWMQWEPVNTYVLHWYYYQSQEGATSESNALYAITASRGDGYISTERTEDYGNTFQLEISVTDTSGMPVDGAVVSLFGPILVYDRDGYWYVGEAYTGADGIARFTLGENNEYLYRIDSPIGSNPIEDNRINQLMSDTVAGEDQYHEITIEATIPNHQITEKPLLETDEVLSVKVDLAHFLSADGYMLRGSMTDPTPTGKVKMFVVDRDNYDLYRSGAPFTAHHLSESVDTVNVDIPLQSDKGWYLVLSNKESLGISSVGSLDISLASNTEEWDGPALNEKIHILPGESITVQLTAAP